MTVTDLDARPLPRVCLILLVAIAGLWGVLPAPPTVATILLLIIIVIFGIGWGQLTRGPRPQVSAIVTFIMAFITALMVRFTLDAWWINIALGFVVVVAFIAEMMAGGRRAALVGSLATTVTSAVGALFGLTWIPVSAHPLWEILSVPMLSALAGAAVSYLVPGRVSSRMGWAVLLGIIASLIGAGVTMMQGGAAATSMLSASARMGGIDPHVFIVVLFVFFGLVGGGMVAMCHALFVAQMRPRNWVSSASLALLPVLTAGMPVYALTRLLGG